jgi:RNA polymerase-binding transcription factor DksA
MRDLTRFADALRARRAELLGEVRAIEDALDDTPPKDWEDRAAERQGDEVLEARGVNDLAEIKLIDAALTRVQDGSYGHCAACGEEISTERLELLPDTPFCAACARTRG